MSQENRTGRAHGRDKASLALGKGAQIELGGVERQRVFGP